FFAIAAVGSVAAAIAYVVFGLVHLLLVLACAAVAISVALLVRAVEYVSMAWRRIFLVCPNANCYRPISLPVYICPNCGAQHKRLIPGPYGIFRRTCKCTAKLPTLFLFGRNRLPSLCPHEDCQRPLNSSIGVVRNLHIPIVGGPAAGKTSFLMASMCELHERSERGDLDLAFPEKKHQTLFERCSRDFQHGALVNKTAEESPDAFQFRLKGGAGHEGLLYVYDAAGELYKQTDVLRRHEYFSYTHGILFLLDPFSLPQVQVDFAPSLEAASDQVKPCEERPQDVYDRMIGTLRQFSKMEGRFGSTPFAVVVTKSDAFGLARQIEAASPRGGANGNSKKEDPESLAVRQWLIERGESNLVRSVENDFKKVRYFHCSSLGRLPDASSSPFDPQGVLDPLGWVLDRYDVRLDRSGHGLLAAPSVAASAQPAYKVTVGGRSYNGAAISTLWVIATVILFFFGGKWAITYPDWSRRTYASNYTPPTYTPTPWPTTVGRRGTATTDINLRSGPNPNSRKVGLAERGSYIRVLSVASDGVWYEVEVTQHGRVKEDRNSSDRGWVNSRYLALQ
ncbi:MAG: SH3 domain-containing protein, partial [Acidobacteriota bacterium]|nr:SH3 domain-containing protein [Acidobacteriota bacterium]